MPIESSHHLPAWDLLASQPVSASPTKTEARDRIVISAQIDDAGCEHVLSRYGDAVWDLRPFIEQLGISGHRDRSFQIIVTGDFIKA
jgi:hypothetical protein